MANSGIVINLRKQRKSIESLVISNFSPMKNDIVVPLVTSIACHLETSDYFISKFYYLISHTMTK